jgi:glycosyltransferase involved in cell wall biosynthesis
MARTLLKHHPDAELTVLVLDGDPRSVGAVEGARLVGLEDVVGTRAGTIAALNPPGALAMAVLAHLARTLLDAGAESVLYIGPGQRILAPLRELERMLASHSIVLVARLGAEPSDRLAAFAGEGARGVFSRELLGLRAGPASTAVLAQWPRCFADVGDDGADAVRAWLERLPALADDVGVLRDPGYGLDPWTLAQRAGLEGGAEEPRLEGRRACVIDFSALDPDDPPSLFAGEGRVSLSDDAALAELTARQAADLLAAGFARDAELPVPYVVLEDGLRLTPTIRALALDAIADGSLTRSPFSADGRVELYGYLSHPGERGRAAGLTRLHMAIWEARPDLRSSYPEIDGPDGAGLAGWLCAYGVEQEGLVAELLPPSPELAYRDADPHVHEDAPRWGVNVAGFFTAELGVGEAARQLLTGLDAASIPALPIQGNLLPPSRRNEDFAYARIDEAAYPVNILCINGDGVPVFAREAGRAFFEGRHTIALWWWEVGDPPAAWSRAYEFVDEVWAATQHIYDAIAPTAPVPVVRMTLPVVPPRVAARTRTELGMPEDGFVFLYVYDYHSVLARKNPLGLIEAFRRAFAPGSGAKLVLKSINAETRPEDHERVELAAGGHSDITLVNAYVSGAEKNAMLAACDCYVSLHRSEGFGLTVAEAMLLGKPVIATRYGGTLEFMDDENSYLVRWEPVEVGEGSYPYSPRDVWAEPDLDHAAELMRQVRAEQDEARQRGQLARRDMLERHSPAVAGEAMRRRLAVVHERLYADGARSLNLAHLPPLSDHDAIEAIVKSPPLIGWGSGRLARLRRLAQRPLDHWSQAYVEHQTKVQAEQQLAVARIDARLRVLARTLQDQQKAQHAETLAVLRGMEERLSGARVEVDDRGLESRGADHEDHDPA